MDCDPIHWEFFGKRNTRYVQRYSSLRHHTSAILLDKIRGLFVGNPFSGKVLTGFFHKWKALSFKWYILDPFHFVCGNSTSI